MYSVFGDESSDERKERVFAVAGVIGGEELWGPLVDRWVARTAGMPFHAKDCESDKGDYSVSNHQENKALYRDLATLLAESGLGGYGFAIDLAAQRRVTPDLPDMAYYKCFVEVVDAMNRCTAYNRESVKFTFDMRPESEYNTGLLYGMMRDSPGWGDAMFSNIAFDCAKSEPRIQVADLFARETMKALDNVVGPVKRPPRKSWVALLNTGRFHIEAISEAWFLDLQGKMPELEKQTGLSMSKYAEWLGDNGLSDGAPSRVRYLEWEARRKRRGESKPPKLKRSD
jgi:hypothetical protein